EQPELASNPRHQAETRISPSTPDKTIHVFRGERICELVSSAQSCWASLSSHCCSRRLLPPQASMLHGSRRSMAPSQSPSTPTALLSFQLVRRVTLDL